tara:strand:- start:120026 stop:120325 length:300 start_codon:yes stop_codon:yes gene_type:complete
MSFVGGTSPNLRGNAVTRLALAECSEAEIATITGHSLKDVGAIRDAHYLKRDSGLAASAIRKLENRGNSQLTAQLRMARLTGNRKNANKNNGGCTRART